MQTLFKVKITDGHAIDHDLYFPDAVKQFQIIDQNLSLTAGAPLHKTEMLALNIYQTLLW